MLDWFLGSSKLTQKATSPRFRLSDEISGGKAGAEDTPGSCPKTPFSGGSIHAGNKTA
jgi:hypothetical protein